jgi:hypothetical protein
MDPELWRIENYLEFLAERRKLLAAAANSFLDELAGGMGLDIEGSPAGRGRPCVRHCHRSG